MISINYWWVYRRGFILTGSIELGKSTIKFILDYSDISGLLWKGFSGINVTFWALSNLGDKGINVDYLGGIRLILASLEGEGVLDGEVLKDLCSILEISDLILCCFYDF